MRSLGRTVGAVSSAQVLISVKMLVRQSHWAAFSWPLLAPNFFVHAPLGDCFLSASATICGDQAVSQEAAETPQADRARPQDTSEVVKRKVPTAS